MAPWKPPPKPTPAIAVPAKKPAAESAESAASVTATPAMSAPMLRNSTGRGSARWKASTAPAATPARMNRLSPPYTTDVECSRVAVSDGPSEA